jgi:hypothetical protein
MTARVGIALNAATRTRFITAEAVGRLARSADVRWLEFDGPVRDSGPPPDDKRTRERLIEFAADLDALIVSHGCPRVDDEVLAAAPSLRMVGDLHGDRFAARIDVAAAARRGVWAVDTTNASSDPVAEWALALILIGLRNAGALFRRLIAGEVLWPDRTVFTGDPGYRNGELTGKTVGIIACGHIGRRLIELLVPFHVSVLVHDPHAPDPHDDQPATGHVRLRRGGLPGPADLGDPRPDRRGRDRGPAPGQRVRQRVPRAGGGLGRADRAAAPGRPDRLPGRVGSRTRPARRRDSRAAQRVPVAAHRRSHGRGRA